MKTDRRRYTSIEINAQALACWGPHVIEQLARGEIVEVAGFRLKARSPQRPAQLELRMQ